jgi:hypothetical protein
MTESVINSVIITVELTEWQAWQLAQFYKRSGFGHYRECATTDEEAYTMIQAMGKIAEAAARERSRAPMKRVRETAKTGGLCRVPE